MNITISGTVMVRIEDESTDGNALAVLTRRLKRSAQKLADAMTACGHEVTFSSHHEGDSPMATTSPELAALETQVAANTDVEESAVILINGLRQKLIDAGTDPAKLKTLADSLKTSADNLASAVLQNTPPVPPVPTP